MQRTDIRNEYEHFVGNLPYETTEDDLRQMFGEFGTVSSANIITDRVSGNSKGFGFVEMDDDEAGQKAVDELNGSDMKGRNIKVNLARPKSDRPKPNRRSW
ncbi:MAG: RNA-binding protein [Candidatus Marinimicrobia bacterium]|nr:RNA-binding protein [Candidatus Neomarinimicrobiota bacterium]